MDMVLASHFLQLLFEAVVTATAPILIGIAFKYVQTYSESVWSSMSADKRYIIRNVITTVVKAAEQTGLADELVSSGEAKKEYAISAAEKMLKVYGLDIDLHVIDTMIEAEVWRQFKEIKDNSILLEG